MQSSVRAGEAPSSAAGLARTLGITNTVLRRLWICWLVALVATALGAVAMHVSEQSTGTYIKLLPGSQATATVVRAARDEVWLTLNIERANPELCAKQGKFHSGTGHVLLTPPDPGEYLSILVEVGGSKSLYSALPASACGHDGMERRLIPLPAESDSNQTLWPPALAAWTTRLVKLPMGRSRISFVVSSVGPSLAAKEAKLVVEPPLVSFKSARASHRFLLLFYFWPLIALLLLALGAVLAWLTLRR